MSLRQTLDEIKADAILEEATGFDPTGTSSVPSHGYEHTPESSVKSAGASTDQEIESLTTALSDLTWDDSLERGPAVVSSWDGLSLDEKVQQFASLVPQTNETTVRFTLRRHNGKFDETMDELLTLAFLDEDEKRNVNSERGLDEYAAAVYRGRGRRKNKQQHRLLNSASQSPNDSTDSLVTRNVWIVPKEDIDFITSRTTLTADRVKSLYRSHGSSMSATITAIATQYAPSSSELHSMDPGLQITAADLHLENPDIAQEKIFGILAVTRNVPSAAQDLITAMTAADVIPAAHTAKIVPKYAPLQVEAAERSTVSRGSRTPKQTAGTDPSSSQHRAATNRLAGQEAFTKASAAYRRGKSDHLMGGAAAYYSDVGRERMMVAKAQLSADADARIEMQSGANFIDLHGISVMDAVRIASDKTEQWWDNLGDAKYTSGGGGAARAGYRIVTGVGRHSKDGAPRIGPAVTKRLLNEGWKVNIGQGELVVTGKRRT